MGEDPLDPVGMHTVGVGRSQSVGPELFGTSAAGRTSPVRILRARIRGIWSGEGNERRRGSRILSG